MQQENDHLEQQIIQLRNQVDTYKQENERLAKEKTELLLTSASSWDESSRINDSLEDLAKVLSYLNVKENQVDDLRKSITSKNDEINLLRE